MVNLGSVVIACFLGVPGPESVDTKFIQVFPEKGTEKPLVRSKGQSRAVVLVHGFRPHLNVDFAAKHLPKAGTSLLKGLTKSSAASAFAKAGFQDWQRAGSILVRNLGKDSDVFSFAYGQNVSLEQVADGPGFAKAVSQLKALGYSEIVLLGHSAGGSIGSAVR